MNIQIATSSLLTLLLFSGCITQETNQPAPEPKTEIVLLSQKVHELNAHDKQLIYRSIQDEINLFSEIGDESYEAGYNFDAITSYELVNFYEGYNTVPLSKINKIKKSAKAKSIYHYKQALLYTQKDKKRALAELNQVMMNDPKYKDAQSRFDILKSTRDIKIFLNSTENSLQMKMLNNSGDIKDLKSINNSLVKLSKYDYKNETAIKAKSTLKEYHKTLLKNAIVSYDKGKLSTAKSEFNSILSIYKKDQTSLNYLQKIRVKNSKDFNLKQAKSALKKKEYISSIAYAKKVLKIDSKNRSAKKVIATAKKESKKEVANLIYIGKQQYNKKKLDKAKESFKAVLHLDPFNNTALIYSKKIERQLSTIKSLR